MTPKCLQTLLENQLIQKGIACSKAGKERKKEKDFTTKGEEVQFIRRYGTTHQAPLYLFGEDEEAALQALPTTPCELCEIRPV